MFDRCHRWRKMLNLRAEGTLTLAQWGALEDHLAHCDHCRLAAEGDDALRDVLGMHTGMKDKRAARIFDDGVLAAMQTAPPTPRFGLVASRLWAIRRWKSLPLDFLRQMAGGGLVAASITVFCLFSALHPNRSSNQTGNGTAAFTTSQSVPLPLETLLQSQSPRAALLWSAPATGRPFVPARKSVAPVVRPVKPVIERDTRADTFDKG